MSYIITKKIFKILGFLLLFYFLLFPNFVKAANLSFSPSTASVSTGDHLVVKVLVNSKNISINAVSGVLSIPENIFTIESVTKSASVLNFWVTEPVISKNTNTIKFEGVVLGGYNGSSGTVLTINLKAVNEGEGRLVFKSGQILANDGQGTDITESMGESVIMVKKNTTDIPVVVKNAKNISSEKVSKTEAVLIKEDVSLQPAPTLKAPEILLGEKYGAEAIVGTSDSPKSQVLITFVSQDGTKIFITGVSDLDGSFVLLVPKSLRKGVYTTTAVVVRADKTNSEASNVVLVTIGNIFSDISWQFWLVFALLVLSIIYLITGIVGHFFYHAKNNVPVKKELKEVKEMVGRSFDILREDVDEYEKNSSNSSGRKQIASLKKDINEAEKFIDKKIDNINE